MPDSFFVSSKQRKRKRVTAPAKAGPSSSKAKALSGRGVQKKRKQDEELDSEHTDEEAGGVDDMDLRAGYDEPSSSEEEDPDETPAAKRLRLAKLYLEGVKKDAGLADGEFDAAEIDKEIISARLKQDVLQHSGRIHLFVADSYDFLNASKTVLRTRGHRFSVTSAVASTSGQHLFTAGKEGSIIKWDLYSGKKLNTFYKIRPSKDKGKAKADDAKGHTDEVLALALSDDGRYLASGGRDRKLVVWDTEKNEWLKEFIGTVGHRDAICSLSFRKRTHQLYTASFDRTIKVYDLSPNVMGYVETLFGHQDYIVGIDSLQAETCVSVGARDKTVRFWKIVDETQLVFRGGGRSRTREVLEGDLRAEDEDEHPATTNKFVEGSLECVAMLDESTFVSGGDSGSICLWTTQKKKSIFTHPLAHGIEKTVSEAGEVTQKPRWITAVTTLRYSDLFASGSWDGEIRLWKLDSTLKSFSLVGCVSALGVVNSLQLFTPPKDFFQNVVWAKTSVNTVSKVSPVLLVAGMGQEHKLGRWLSLKNGAINGCITVVLAPRT